MSDELPKSIAVSELTVMGVTLRCHVLDDGRRIIESGGLAQLFGEGATVGMLDGDDAEKLSAFLGGGPA